MQKGDRYVWCILIYISWTTGSPNYNLNRLITFFKTIIFLLSPVSQKMNSRAFSKGNARNIIYKGMSKVLCGWWCCRNNRSWNKNHMTNQNIRSEVLRRENHRKVWIPIAPGRHQPSYLKRSYWSINSFLFYTLVSFK